MRIVLAGLVALLCVCLVNPAQAERRMFIIASDADGYGIDRCLATGAKCGAAAASAYCKVREFAEATSYHKADRDDITGVIPNRGSGGCKSGKCEDLVAIVCSR